MRVFLMTGLIGLSVAIDGCGDSNAEKPQPPKKSEERIQREQLNRCQMDARHDGKNDPSLALQCKENLGQQVCEETFTKEACSATKEDIEKFRLAKNEEFCASSAKSFKKIGGSYQVKFCKERGGQAMCEKYFDKASCEKAVVDD